MVNLRDFPEEIVHEVFGWAWVFVSRKNMPGLVD